MLPGSFGDQRQASVECHEVLGSQTKNYSP